MCDERRAQDRHHAGPDPEPGKPGRESAVTQPRNAEGEDDDAQGDLPLSERSRPKAL